MGHWKHILITLVLGLYVQVGFCAQVSWADSLHPVHGLSLYGPVKYPANFIHFDYVNPDAPKGGTLRLAALGNAFDSFNPFILRGIPAEGSGYVFETLLVPSADEPFSEYGLVAKDIIVPNDRAWVIFNLRPQARWQDGKAITADDVVFSFHTLLKYGHPQYRFYYQAIESVQKLAPLQVKFTFKSKQNRELPLIIGQMPLLPQHYWQGRDFTKTVLVPPLGSGPYRIVSFDAGHNVIYQRVKDYWGKDLPTQKGRYNFDQIRFDYYRDSTIALEALKAGAYDLRVENEAKKWAVGYSDWRALTRGLAVKKIFPNQRPMGMQAFIYNTRHPLFQDIRVRQALAYAFDFEWTNKQLFYGQYKRTNSYFSNSELAAVGQPSSAELAVLNPLRNQIPPQVFGLPYQAPQNDGSGNIRPNLKKAMALLEQAGWHVEDGRLVKDHQMFNFEIMLNDPAFERIVLPFIGHLKRLGIEASTRVVDPAQYKQRVDNYNFDMIVGGWPESNSPGNEQLGYWTSAAADMIAGDNIAGIKNPAIDKLVTLLIQSPNRAILVARTRALDRVLTWNYYVIPQWHLGVDRYVFWDKFAWPKTIPANGVDITNWWIKPQK